MTAPRWSIRGVPVEIAERAIGLGWAFARDSWMVGRLLDTGQLAANGPWHAVDPRDCIDLSTVNAAMPRSSICHGGHPTNCGIFKGMTFTAPIGQKVRMAKNQTLVALCEQLANAIGVRDKIMPPPHPGRAGWRRQ